MAFGVLLRHAAQQHDRLGDDEFGNERVLEYGALNTGMPASAAASRSTWLVPMQKQPTAIRRLARASTSAVSWVRERMPTMCASAMRSSSSSRAAPWRGTRSGCRRREREHGGAADAFQQQHADVLLRERGLSIMPVAEARHHARSAACAMAAQRWHLHRPRLDAARPAGTLAPRIPPEPLPMSDPRRPAAGLPSCA
jgi:hypothetical protein